MSSQKDFQKYSKFIEERSKRIAKDAAARLELIEDLYNMIQIAKRDYELKKANHAPISKS